MIFFRICVKFVHLNAKQEKQALFYDLSTIYKILKILRVCMPFLANSSRQNVQLKKLAAQKTSLLEGLGRRGTSLAHKDP